MTEEKSSNYRNQGRFKEGNKQGEKTWQATRRRLLEKHGIDVEALDNGELEIDA